MQLIAYLLLLLSALVSASYHHAALPWQQYYSPNQGWSSQKSNRQVRVRAGVGRYRMLQGVAELLCEFPHNYRLISNIIWDRADLNGVQGLDDLYKSVGEEHRYRVTSWENGSRLLLMSPTPTSRGLYRCLATATDPAYPHPITVFQDVHFYPQLRSKWYPKHTSKPCCRAMNYDDFARHTEYHDFKYVFNKNK